MSTYSANKGVIEGSVEGEQEEGQLPMKELTQGNKLAINTAALSGARI